MGIARTPVKPHCQDCGRQLGPTTPRLIIEGWWICPDCVYRREHPEAEIANRTRARGKPQKETLF